MTSFQKASLLQEELQSLNNEIKKHTFPKDLDYFVSENPEEYIILEEDFLRNSPKEISFMLKHKALILSMYGNRCAACKTSTNGIDFDHYYISKNRGGCFQMQHRNGYLVCNAVPLCVSCNRSKGDRHYSTVCSREQSKFIHELNQVLTKIVNQK